MTNAAAVKNSDSPARGHRTQLAASANGPAMCSAATGGERGASEPEPGPASSGTARVAVTLPGAAAARAGPGSGASSLGPGPRRHLGECQRERGDVREHAGTGRSRANHGHRRGPRLGLGRCAAGS
jgi:hypothetical protein